MPTPVGIARQCLAEAAAAVLDGAVTVARRRSHSQTTSLHVVSALLALPSSALREACTRDWSSEYSPRLQFRALELCVGVALDRVSVSKSAADEPMVSNSLMTAIKRSQANQRRHPETFHLYQQQLSSYSHQNSVSAVKVELKHFLLSILDDPIVSRVFGDAGFRTQEIKLAVQNPLVLSRFTVSAPRPPHRFACSRDNFELSKRVHIFPFPEAAANEEFNESSRIGEVLSRKTRRNPLLIGVCASDAYRNFADCLKGGESGAVPKVIDGLTLVSIEREILECIGEGLGQEMMELKFKQMDEIVKDCKGPGIIANCGDFKAFLDVGLVDVVSNLVLKLKKLLIEHCGKLWLIGFLTGDGDYKKLQEQFPSIEIDLDLHLLPVTSSSLGGRSFKSSLMRSFVPFGGFFPLPSEFKSPGTNVAKPMRLCKLGNEKYEKEVSDVQKGVSINSVADNQSINPDSWLQNAQFETSKRSCTEEEMCFVNRWPVISVQAKKDETVSDARVMALQRKWSRIYQMLHCSRTSEVDNTLPKPNTSIASPLQQVLMQNDAVRVDSLSNGSKVTNSSPCIPSESDWQKTSPPKQHVPGSQERTNLPVACSSSPAVVRVATDLTLATFHDSSEETRRNPDLQDHCSDVHTSESSRCIEKPRRRISQSSSCSPHHGSHIYTKDLEHQWGVLAQKVYWQSESIQTISRTVSLCRSYYDCSKKGSIWLSFLGPDKVGKRKIAASVAEIVFGGKEHLLYLDLSTQDTSLFTYIVDCYDSRYKKVQSGRKLTVDWLAEELSKHPHSVVLLENVDKSDFLVQSSLSQAIKIGKFQDSCGRDINIDNHIFFLASTLMKGCKDLPFGKKAPDFQEETISEAQNLQMQFLVESGSDIYSRSNSSTCVTLLPSKVISNPSHSSKRKLMNDDSTKGEISKRSCQWSRSFIDLNLPVDGTGEDTDTNESDDTDSSEAWLEELLDHVDENVVFKPFDFDSLCGKIVREIDIRVRKIAGPRVLLEIDRQVMVQILAAAWLTETENALEDWIEQILCSGVDEARRRCNASSDIVLKLVPCDGVVVKEQACGVCLPARIRVN